MSRSALYALVPCAGQGSRSGAPMPKQYMPVAALPVVVHTLKALHRGAAFAGILVVLSPQDDRFESVVGGALDSQAPMWPQRCGGDTRADSVLNGLRALRERGASDDDWVLVHDAARCLLRPDTLSRLMQACQDDPVGGLLAVPIPDTLKRSQGEDGQERSVATLDRRGVWAAQTPQMFRLGLLERALDAALQAGVAVTDEASAVEWAGHHPRLVRGCLDNIKITYAEDFAWAEQVLERHT